MVNRRSIFLYPFSLIYGLITGIRNFLYNKEVLSSIKFNLPVISVGNITVGGTGKTPHTEYLVRLLSENFRVATLSRGYKRKTRGFQIATSASIVNDIGDEPLQMSRKFPEITVAVDRNRIHGVNTILKERPGTEVILLDDAFQHRRIKPGLSILLTDFDRLMSGDNLLPYGNLRESLDNIRRADIIIVTKSPENISPDRQLIIASEISKAPYQYLFFSSLIYNEPIPLFDKKRGENIIYDISRMKEMNIVLVTGIANPKPLKEYIQRNFGGMVHLDFHDHHQFTNSDLEKIRLTWKGIRSPLKYVITTEKDAVRLQEFTNIAEPFRSSFYYVPVRISFLNDERDKFDNLIVDYVRKNKRNNRVSQG